MFIKELIFMFLLREVALLPYERCTDFIVKENWDYRDDDFDEKTIQPTDADCCAQCSDDEDCNAFTWVQDSNECWLHSKISDGRSSNLTTYAGYHRDAVIDDQHSYNSINDSSIHEIKDSTGRIGYASHTGSTSSKVYACDPNAPCGCSKKPAITARIVGGDEAVSSTWSWTVFLHFGKKSCGGSIIAASWILTAAHCLEDISVSQITVYAGSNKKWIGSQILSVSTILVHPSFDKDTFVNDIALLHLSTPLNLTDPHVGIICLPSTSSATSSTDEWPPSETKTIAVGWGGLDETGPLSRILRQVTLQTINHQSTACSNVINDPSVQFCAFALGKDACRGDSGGPLMAFTSSKQWVLAGVISYGFGCARPNYAGVYTRIAAYRMWIASSISDQLIHADSSDLTSATTRGPGTVFPLKALTHFHTVNVELRRLIYE